ncbi:NADH dehydrogenase [ubiquinone] 1 beta subcomplex subunit 2 [Abortiporus biennis]
MAGAHSNASGFHPHLPGFKYKLLSTTLGATMWFFIFYRARKDGAKLLGLSHPWEAHGHDHGSHEEHH